MRFGRGCTREDVAATQTGAPAIATIAVVVVNQTGWIPCPSPAIGAPAGTETGRERAAERARSVNGQGTHRTLPTRRAMAQAASTR